MSFRWLQRYMDDGIFLTTNHRIFTIAGYRSKDTSNGSNGYVFIPSPWHGLLSIDVEGDLPVRYQKTFVPPTRNVTDTYHTNHSQENEIMRMTVDEVKLIKKEAKC